LSINSIQARFFTPRTSLTQDQAVYLENLQAILPDSLNQSGISAWGVAFGFNKTLEHFKLIDFLQIFLRAAVSFPAIMYNENQSIIAYPFNLNSSFGYPITTMISVGFAKHLIFGWYGIIIPAQPSRLNSPVNKTTSQNQLLMTDFTLVELQPNPTFASTWYLQLYNWHPKWAGLIGYSYLYIPQATITAINQTAYPTQLINNNSTLFEGNASSIMFEIDYSTMPSPDDKLSPWILYPTFSLFYTMTLAGKLVPKINVWGGSYNLRISFDF